MDEYLSHIKHPMSFDIIRENITSGVFSDENQIVDAGFVADSASDAGPEEIMCPIAVGGFCETSLDCEDGLIDLIYDYAQSRSLNL